MVIADEIVCKLKDNDMFKEVSNVNGFINITLSDKALIDYLNEIVNNFDVNTFKINTDETIFLDYGGANVAKALHAGHLRSPNIGEALKRLCEAVGYKTISDVHYGDWGRPMGLIICEIKHRYPNLDFFNPNLDSYPKESPVTLEDLYDIYPLASAKAKEDEDYLNEARELTVKLQKKEKGIYDLYKAFTKLSILDIEDIYKKLNCTFDLYEGERDADDYIEDVLTVTKPFTTISNGATIIDVKEDNTPSEDNTTTENKNTNTNNNKEQKDSTKTEETSSIEDVIYPMYLPSNTHLSNKEKVTKESGERLILTFDGDNPFMLIEETIAKEKEHLIVPTYGDLELMASTVAIVNENSVNWIDNNIEYYVVSDKLSKQELLNIARSISVLPVSK